MADNFDELFKFDMGDMFKDMENQTFAFDFKSDVSFDMDLSMPKEDDFASSFDSSFKMFDFADMGDFKMPDFDFGSGPDMSFDFGFDELEKQPAEKPQDFEKEISDSLSRAKIEEIEASKETEARVVLAKKEVVREGKKRRREAFRFIYDLGTIKPDGPEGVFYKLLGNINSYFDKLDDIKAESENQSKQHEADVLAESLSSERVHYEELAHHRKALSEEYAASRIDFLEQQRKCQQMHPNLFDRVGYSYYTWAVVWDQIAEEKNLKKLDKISSRHNASLRSQSR